MHDSRLYIKLNQRWIYITQCTLHCTCMFIWYFWMLSYIINCSQHLYTYVCLVICLWQQLNFTRKLMWFWFFYKSFSLLRKGKDTNRILPCTDLYFLLHFILMIDQLTKFRLSFTEMENIVRNLMKILNENLHEKIEIVDWDFAKKNLITFVKISISATFCNDFQTTVSYKI